MRTYYLVLLRRGPAWTDAESPERAALGEAHMANIQRLVAKGSMVVAGPVLDQTGLDALTGVFVLNAASLEAARALVDSDPAVRAGRFSAEIAPWLAPSSLRI